ncbi:MAG: diaminopimelate decarboxylase [Oscillospiraceae bacterium]|nr:diaminopimelate decarboxylase [Oscillospiraceae bacterium]
MEPRFICGNLSLGPNGRLFFAGQDTSVLAEKYGTPLYLLDADHIRAKCRLFKRCLTDAFGGRGHILYASKAASFKRIYEIMNEEDMCVDVVSPGEIYTALKAGFPPERAWFHSNNKSDEDIAFAIDHGIGHFVIDSTEELLAVNAAAAERGIRQKLLLRLTPGIDTHTFEAVDTGKVDSKFGFAIETGQAEEIFRLALTLANIDLRGFHCHVGSQLFDSDVFLRSAKIMLDFMAHVKAKYGYEAEQLNLGGGFGVPYVLSDPEPDIESILKETADGIRSMCREHGMKMPEIGFEPGRCIVADAGLTLYTVGMVKKIPGFINYVSVDGGMTDNPRYALYGAEYTVLPAGRMEEDRNMICSVVGRCCESGDIIQPDVPMPETMRRGDLVAVCTTGAYNYSMASNYNRVPRPPVVMLSGGESYVAVKRETLDDMLMLDE